MSAPVFDGPMPGEEEAELVETVSLVDASTSMTAVDKASIDMQIATAKQYPRTISKSLKEALSLATLDEQTAGTMFYALPRGKGAKAKVIEGPSARLAEVMAYSWGNLRVDADIVAEDKTTVTAMGTCFDLEKNVAVRVRVKRRITDSSGRRYNEDMIGVTSNAAISIALRNSVFKVVPRAFVDRIYAAARKASIGKGGTIAQKRQNAIELFGKMGVKPEQLFAVLDVKDVDDIGEDQLITLRGLLTAIKDGEITVEHAFRPTDKSDGAQELNAALAPKPRAEPEPAAPMPKEPAKAPPATEVKPGTVCQVCGGENGTHLSACPYAD